MQIFIWVSKNNFEIIFWKTVWPKKLFVLPKLSHSEEAQSFLQGFSFFFQSDFAFHRSPRPEARDRTQIIICNACWSTSWTKQSCSGQVASFQRGFQCWYCSGQWSVCRIVDNLIRFLSSCSWNCCLVWSTAFGCLCCRLNCSCSSMNCSFAMNSCRICSLPLRLVNEYLVVVVVLDEDLYTSGSIVQLTEFGEILRQINILIRSTIANKGRGERGAHSHMETNSMNIVWSPLQIMLTPLALTRFY